MQYDSKTKRPLPFSDYAHARSRYDRPFRWYDAAIPYDFPEFPSANSATRGQIIRRPRVRGGYFLQTLGDWEKGRLAWVHTQTGMKPSRYAIYFELLPKDQKPETVPPRGWLGDGMARCDKLGSTTIAGDHCRIDVVDWNGDGLQDILIGEEYGHLIWMPNVGTKSDAKFTHTRLVLDAKGQPVDAGVHFAPRVFDWDGDGIQDLLAGTYRNRIVFYKNIGTKRNRRLEYRGQVKIDGRPLELPVRPLVRGNAAVFKNDYYPVLEFVDWDRDGDVDLLAGGYITGRVFLYENTGRGRDGTPKLKLKGPIQSDGKPLNVRHWCAAPCVADFDGDGDFDLVSGFMPMYEHGKRRERGHGFLRYYENVGTRAKPVLQERAFPGKGVFPSLRLATPRAVDIDDDGDLDLIVSARSNIYILQNAGSRRKPRFVAPKQPLPSYWGSSTLAVDRFLDWNGDGKPDIVKNYTVRLHSGRGNPGEWKQSIFLLPKGKFISHPSQIGDDWFRPYVDDFDGDGKYDVLFGDWFGHVWLHRNLSTSKQTLFDLKGVRLKLATGKFIKVGPINKDTKKSFVALQGARTVLSVADVDGDKRRDLIVGDTFGKVRYFRNIGSGKQPRFAEPILVGDLGIRLMVETTDWNKDHRPDIIAGAANGRVRLFLNTGKPGVNRFGKGIAPRLPPIMQPRVLMTDLNGDGDVDLFLPSTQGSCFVERSFLKRGYAKATLLKFERKPE